MDARMPDTLTVPRGEDDPDTGAECRPDPGSRAEARTGARETAAGFSISRTH